MKYSKKKILKAVAVLALVVTVFLSLGKFHNTTCNGFDIKIMDSSENNFINSDSVLHMLYSVNGDIEGYKMDSINTYAFDERLRQCPYIRKASIYKSISGKLHVDVQQRKPILMVLGDKQNYYIDNDAVVFAASDRDACQCIVVNGYVNDHYNFGDGQIYRADTTQSKKQTRDLFKLAKQILSDDFWSDQIEQIFINKLGEYELVPMAGAHVLELGSIEDYDKKLYTLKQFYFKALPKLGWNTYQRISVKYKNQVVCKRKKSKE